MSYEYVLMIPDIESFRLVPHITNIIECLKIPKFSHDPYGCGNGTSPNRVSRQT